MISTTTRLRTDEVFDRAADLIERNGLHTIDFWPDSSNYVPLTPSMPCCTIAALIAVQYPTAPSIPLSWVEMFPDDEHVIAFARHLGLTLTTTHLIALWSDKRTRDDVVVELRAAAAKQRSHVEGATA